MILKNYFAIVLIYLLAFILKAPAQQPKLIMPMGHTHDIVLAAFNPDGKTVATASRDKTIKIWDVNTGKLLADLKGHTGEINSLAYNATGDRILTLASLDSVAKLWDANTGQLVQNINNGSYIYDFAIFREDKIIIRNFCFFHQTLKR